MCFVGVFQENNFLREQVDSQQHKDDELKSVQEELATLEQIRYGTLFIFFSNGYCVILIALFIFARSVGKLCKRCLRSTIPTEDCSSADELSLVMSSDEQEIARSIVTAFFGSESSSTVSEVIFVSAINSKDGGKFRDLPVHCYYRNAHKYIFFIPTISLKNVLGKSQKCAKVIVGINSKCYLYQ